MRGLVSPMLLHPHPPGSRPFKSVPYAEQLFFAGLASLSYLPATAAPIGLTAEGLPVGLQIIGPEGEDPTTIAFARLLATEIGGFVPPPAYT